MKATIGSTFRRVGVLLLLLFSSSCATLPYLNLTYRLPVGKPEVKGKTVSLSIQDERRSKAILGPGALDDFGSSETVSLAISEGGGPAYGMGIYDYPRVLKEAFRKRLEHAGIAVASGGETAEAEIAIAVQDFFLDLVSRRWQFRMRYEARLVKGDRVVASQNINGEGERLKILGRDQAEEVVGEVFSDTLNQLNPGRLLAQGGL